jgi:hypothetical protein
LGSFRKNVEAGFHRFCFGDFRRRTPGRSPFSSKRRLRSQQENWVRFAKKRRRLSPLVLCWLSKAYTGSATVLVDELDARFFKRPANGQVVRSSKRCGPLCHLGASNRICRDCRCVGQVHRTPSQQRASRSNLFASKTLLLHLTAIYGWCKLPNIR